MREFVEHANLSERVGTVEVISAQHADLPRVKAVEAAHRRDAVVLPDVHGRRVGLILDKVKYQRRLTARGEKVFAPFETRSQQQAGGMLAKLPTTEQVRLVAAMTTIEGLLGAPSQPSRDYVLRAPRPGDLGRIVTRHAELYAEEYGWGAPFEGLCAQIVADFDNNFDAKVERCWIVEMNGENVGCVMLVKDKQPKVARIRLLLVDPKARGLGLGARLVDECVRFSRKAGYKKITLWTHSVLAAARHVYEKAGFTLTRSEKRKSWGKEVVAEFWDLEL